MSAPFSPESARTGLALAFWKWYGQDSVPQMPTDLYSSVMFALNRSEEPKHDPIVCRYCAAHASRDVYMEDVHKTHVLPADGCDLCDLCLSANANGEAYGIREDPY